MDDPCYSSLFRWICAVYYNHYFVLPLEERCTVEKSPAASYFCNRGAKRRTKGKILLQKNVYWGTCNKITARVGRMGHGIIFTKLSGPFSAVFRDNLGTPVSGVFVTIFEPRRCENSVVRVRGLSPREHFAIYSHGNAISCIQRVDFQELRRL